jgi:hypothetical protein
MQEDIEIVFIEYRLSSLPRCKSPMRQLEPSPRCIISIDESLMDSIRENVELYELMYLTDGIIARQYGRLKLHNFPKMCKLHFLQKIKLSGKPIVVFAPLDIIDQLGPEFISESENGFIRKIRCGAYFFQERFSEKYYVIFNSNGCPIGGLNSFTYEKIAVLSPTALT